MKLYLIVTCLLLSCLASHAQKLRFEKRVTDHSVYVKGGRFEGVIFDEHYKDKLWGGFNNFERFTPNGADVVKIEAILRRKLPDTTAKHNQQFIQKNLEKYVRQYIGIVNAKGEREVFISFLWKEDLDVSDIAKIDSNTDLYYWKKNWVTVFDGGNHCWQIMINLKKSKIFDFSVNGEG